MEWGTPIRCHELNPKLRFAGWASRVLSEGTEVDPSLMYTHTNFRIHTHTLASEQFRDNQLDRLIHLSTTLRTKGTAVTSDLSTTPIRTRVASRLPPIPSYSSSFPSWNSHLYSQYSNLLTTPDPKNLQAPLPASLDLYTLHETAIVEHEQLLNYLDAKLLFTDDAFRLMNLM
jgi:hypothetical protein